MKKILFVEDNEMLLELYSLMLDRDRDRWQTALAPDGATALKLLQQTTFDVVATDMQMPGMNGVELLTEVRHRHPQTSRIIISGFTDQADAANSLHCTHQFIPKPFNVQALRAALDRLGSLDAFLQDEKLRRLAGKMRALPTFPTLYLDIMREIESPTSSLQGVAAVVAKDPGLTAKIFQLANSGALGRAERLSDPAEAVQRLGLSTVRALALSAQVYGSFAPGRLPGFSAETLWAHLMNCGELARAILRHERAGVAAADDAFTAGLLHDMGKLMLADSLPNEFARALALAEEEQMPLPDAEMAVFGATHAGLAAYLLGLWGLPAAIVEAVAFHHTPEKSDVKEFSVLTAVHVANALADESRRHPVNLDYLAEIGVADRWDGWRALAAEPSAEPTA